MTNDKICVAYKQYSAYLHNPERVVWVREREDWDNLKIVT